MTVLEIPAAPAAPPASSPKAHAVFAATARWRWEEIAFWVVAAASIVLFPTHLVLIAQVLITGLFALSFDLLVGYAGIPSLGHAAFFGLGAYTAGLLAHNGWGEPITGLIAGAIVAGLFGLLLSVVVSRLTGIALIMITLGVGLLLYEAAHSARGLTGGDDGLSGINMAPLLGHFDFDFYGRTAVIYTYIVVFLLYLVARRIVNSPFGLELKGIRENVRRVPALGVPLRNRYMVAFTVSAALAGVAGALLAQITQTVALSSLSFDRSAAVLIMVMIGGMGTLIGSLVGAAAYMVAQDRLSDLNPVYWNFYVGLLLVLFVLFARGGLIGGVDRLIAWVRAKRERSS
jgi:branched-chain amino acid transport system permease protein